MQKPFDSIAYIAHMGKELVANFQAGGLATTPGLKGSAREVSVREKLEHLLPRGVAVGSGCVIDSFGGTSRQMDVVLYESAFCPVYRISQDPAATYYPCEGVIAVGEIKSSLTSADLQDIFAKIRSVKELRRFVRRESERSDKHQAWAADVAFRHYGSPLTAIGSKSEEYNQETKPTDQIYGFALAGTTELSPQTLCSKFTTFAAEAGRPLSPNLIVTLDDGILCPVVIHDNQLTVVRSPQQANAVYFVKDRDRSIPFLLSHLQRVYREGRTVSTEAYDRYIVSQGNPVPPSGGYFVPLLQCTQD